MLHIDFETRSPVDLRKAGLDVYSKDPNTEWLCLGYAFNDEPVQILIPGQEAPRLLEYIEAGQKVVAHNAHFELGIWNHVCVPRYFWPTLRVEQMICTMAQAYAMALPGSLDQASLACGIEITKDMVGKRVMMQLSQPRRINPDGSIVWWEDEERLKRLYDYCKQDVEVERALHKRLLSLSKKEQKIWVMDYEINQRGIAIDVPAVKAAMVIVEFSQLKLDREMQKLTNGALSSCTQAARLTSWLSSRGIELKGVAKSDVLELLKNPALPEDCKRALILRQEAAKSSTAKLASMLEGVSPDGRIRGVYQYHAASPGRWGGRRLQTQNLPRPNLKQDEIESVFHIINSYPTQPATEAIDLIYGPPLQIISDCLRGFLVAAPGKELIAADFANIEGRVLAWLANERWKITAFEMFDAGAGPDLYKVMASLIYGVEVSEVTKDQRLLGKVAELACGYQGGVGAFKAMGKNYNLSIPDETANSIKTRWRENNRSIVKYWWDLEKAAKLAVRHPKTEFPVGEGKSQVRFKVQGSFLWCKLPSGRVICYPYPKLGNKTMPWGDLQESLSFMSVNAVSRKWEEEYTYGGTLCQNITQATSRCILADAMLRLDEARYPIVMHVHDEIVCETPKGFGSKDQMELIMSKVPEWAQGLPIAAEGWAGARYRK